MWEEGGVTEKDTAQFPLLPFMWLRSPRAHEDCGAPGCVAQPSLYHVPDRWLTSPSLHNCPHCWTCFLVASFFFFLPQDRIPAFDFIYTMNLWRFYPCKLRAGHKKGHTEESHQPPFRCSQLIGRSLWPDILCDLRCKGEWSSSRNSPEC